MHSRQHQQHVDNLRKIAKGYTEFNGRQVTQAFKSVGCKVTKPQDLLKIKFAQSSIQIIDTDAEKMIIGHPENALSQFARRVLEHYDNN
ncbi:MAG: hypothetical protein ACRBDL_06480 [Alphaproteobacteria bacterium]